MPVFFGHPLTYRTYLLAKMYQKIVQLKPGFFLERMDEEIVVYHPTLTTSLYLNETGALVWQLCDGERTLAEIIELLCRMYPESAQRIGPEVIALLGSFVARQVAELR